MAPKKSKVSVRYDVEIVAITDVDSSCDLNGVVFHWKRTSSKGNKGTSHPILLHSPATSLEPLRDRTQFRIRCNYMRDARSGSFSPEKKLKIAIQTEDIAKGSKGVFGRCSIALSPLAKDGNVAQLSLPLSDSPFRRPPTLHVTLRTHWETVDGFTLRVVSADDTASPKLEKKSSTGSSHKGERRSTFGSSLTHDRPDKTSLFPQRKAQIGGVTYEMYENDQEETPDGALSYRSDANASESELDFTCDEGDEDAFTEDDMKVKLRKKKKEVPKAAVLRRPGNQGPVITATGNVTARFEVTVLSASHLPPGSEDKRFYVSWRRGSKKKNSGKTSLAVCTEGDVVWTSLSEEPITVFASMIKDLKTQRYMEKSLALNLKRSGVGNEASTSVGHLIIDLADYAKNALNHTETFSLVARPVTQSVSKRKSLMRSISSIKHIDPSTSTGTKGAPRNKSDVISPEEASKNAKPPHLELNICCEFLDDDALGYDSEESDDGTRGALSSSAPSPRVAPAIELPPKKVSPFGSSLLDQLIHNGVRVGRVPPVFSFLARSIEEVDGLTREGIFRLSGRSGMVKQLMEELEAAPAGVTPTFDIAEYGPHELADVLKKYFRALPDSLLPETFYDEYLALGQEYLDYIQHDKRQPKQFDTLVEKVRTLLSVLPPEHTATCRALFALLHRTQESADINKMHSDNLATVFAPTLIRKEFEDPSRFLSDNSRKIAFIKLLLAFSPQWNPIADFSAIDKKLLDEEDKLSPRVRVLRMEEKIKRLQAERDAVKQEVEKRDKQIELMEYGEFIMRTPTHYNINKEHYQAAIDIVEALEDRRALASIQSAFLYTTIKSLQILHRRTVRDLMVNSFWLAVCLDMLDMWQSDENLLFCGNVKRLGIATVDQQLEYQPRLLERWEPNEASIQSSSHFEKQFETFTRVVFYSLCRNFVEENESVLITLCDSSSVFDESDSNKSQRDFVLAAAKYLKRIQMVKLSSVVISQIVRGIFRESTRFLQRVISQRKELCGVDAGLQLKMNWTLVLHGIKEDRFLSTFRALIEEEMQPLHSLANLLVSLGNFSSDLFPSASDLLSMFPLLDPESIADILENYSFQPPLSAADCKHKDTLIEEIIKKTKQK